MVLDVAFLLKCTFIIDIPAGSVFEKLKDQSLNAQNRRSNEKENCIYETYKNTFMPHGRHIYAKTFDMENATMYTYTQSDHVITHWKCVLQYCAECQHINITDQ